MRSMNGLGNSLRLASLVLLVAILAGCVDDDGAQRTGLFGSPGLSSSGRPTPASFQDQFESLGEVRSGDVRRIGTGTFVNDTRLRHNEASVARVTNDGELVEVDLLNASIPAAAEAVLGEALGRPYTVSDGLSGSVTIQTTGAMQKSALLQIFESALRSSGARIEQEGSIFNIVPVSDARLQFVGPSSREYSDGAIVVAPVKFVSADEMADLLSELVGDRLTITRDEKRNYLILRGSPATLEAAVDALNVFDVDVLGGRSIALVRLDAADPEEVSRELEIIFDTREDGALRDVVEFLPNPRLKSVLVLSTSAEYISRAESWIRQLDQTAGSARRYSEVYPLNNRSAEIVAPLLSEILAQSQSVGVASDEIEGANVPEPVEEAIQILADTERNAVIARAFRIEHQEIRRVLAELDTPASQVLLEATIAEVTLNDELSLGVRWFFENGNFSFTFSDVASGAVTSSFPGFSGIFANGADRVALDALATVSDVKVISTPSIMVRSNQEAELRIGDQVPIATQTSQGTGDIDAPIITTIEYRDTGVILKVRPRIGSRGQVEMQIEQETSDVVATTTSGIDSPTIRQRSVTTDVVVSNEATLVLGGIIQERDTVVNTKVPGLGDVPVVGQVFRSKRNDVERTELLVLIRPLVLRTENDVREATQIWRRKLGGADDLILNGGRLQTHANPFER